MKRTGRGFSAAGLKGVLPGLADGLELFAGRIMEQSQEIVPVDTGTLASSASIEPAEFLANQVIVELGYAIGPNGDLINPKTGNAANTYAVDVHEITNVTHAPPTRAKFLEDPVYTNADQMGDYLAIAVQERVG